MKKLSLLLIALVSLSVMAKEDTTSNSSSKSSKSSSGSLAFGQGDNVIGLGFAFDYNWDYNYGTPNTTSLPGFGVLWDHGFITDYLSIGAGLDNYFHDRGNGNTEYVMSPTFRFGFHPFGLPPLQGDISVANVLDPYVLAYGGFMTSIYDGASNVDFDLRTNPYWGLNVGIRWYITPGFGLMAEGDWNHALLGVHFAF